MRILLSILFILICVCKCYSQTDDFYLRIEDNEGIENSIEGPLVEDVRSLEFTLLYNFSNYLKEYDDSKNWTTYKSLGTSYTGRVWGIDVVYGLFNNFEVGLELYHRNDIAKYQSETYIDIGNYAGIDYSASYSYYSQTIVKGIEDPVLKFAYQLIKKDNFELSLSENLQFPVSSFKYKEPEFEYPADYNGFDDGVFVIKQEIKHTDYAPVSDGVFLSQTQLNTKFRTERFALLASYMVELPLNKPSQYYWVVTDPIEGDFFKMNSTYKPPLAHSLDLALFYQPLKNHKVLATYIGGSYFSHLSHGKWEVMLLDIDEDKEQNLFLEGGCEFVVSERLLIKQFFGTTVYGANTSGAFVIGLEVSCNVNF